MFTEDDTGALLCPICGHNFTHLEGVSSDLGGTGKRLNGYLEFSCEKGCEFTIDITQHKGKTWFAHSGHDNSHAGV